MDADVKREFDRLQKMLKVLTAAQEKATWVSPSWITDITGWDKEKLRQVREQKIVEFKKSDGGGWVYKLESVPQQFIKQKQPS
jgi:hypothetical protein